MGAKEAYQKKLQAEMDEWKAEIARLKSKADQASADAQLEYYKHIEDLRMRQESASEKLHELEQAGENAWEDLKAGIDRAWDDVRGAFRSATDRFK